jgi:predicted 3-demethylubiquinone-9 3-methyltransferase (glyoxalase superfamily)
MRKITPFLWFDGRVEEAMNHYLSVFRNARIRDVRRAGDGTVRFATFEHEGLEFIAFDGGPHHRFNDAVSLFVNCETQAEVDELWGKLSEGGQPGRCGWLKDKFGLSWQIVPSVLGELLGDSDPVKSGRVMQALLRMNKLDIEALRRAHAGE